MDTPKKLAINSRMMLNDFLSKHFDKTIPKKEDNDTVAWAKSRFASIIEHLFEGEYLYFLNPVTKSDEKPDFTKLKSSKAGDIAEALNEPRDRLIKALEPYEGKLNEKLPNVDMTPGFVYFWMIEHDAWHHGQMELLVETIEKGSLQPKIVFDEEE